jgi:hypothetical protein
VVPAVAAAAAIILFVFTAGQPAATAAIVEHTFIVSMPKFHVVFDQLIKAPKSMFASFICWDIYACIYM